MRHVYLIQRRPLRRQMHIPQGRPSTISTASLASGLQRFGPWVEPGSMFVFAICPPTPRTHQTRQLSANPSAIAPAQVVSLPS